MIFINGAGGDLGACDYGWMMGTALGTGGFYPLYGGLVFRLVRVCILSWRPVDGIPYRMKRASYIPIFIAAATTVAVELAQEYH